MKDMQKGLSISILVHGFILIALCVAWIDKPMNSKVISLDFLILNPQGSEGAPRSLTGDKHSESGMIRQQIAEKEKANTPKAEQESRIIATARNLSFLQQQAPRDASGMPSDNDGKAEVEVYGEAGSSSGDGDTGTGISSLAMVGQSTADGGFGGSEGRTIRYGSGSADEKTFRYIRNGIIKNVRYPEKARRKGLAGRTLLSFMVTENGVTSDVKVINSSGFTDLDESAKNAVARTRFSQKIPYKLFVILPIEYRLE